MALSAPVFFRGTRSIPHYLPTLMHFFLSQKVISTRCHQFATRRSWHCDTRRLYISWILAFSKLLRKLRLSPKAFTRLETNLKWGYFATFFTGLSNGAMYKYPFNIEQLFTSTLANKMRHFLFSSDVNFKTEFLQCFF